MSSGALKHCLASDRKSRIPLLPNLMVCYCTKISFTRSSRPTLACANIGATLSWTRSEPHRSWWKRFLRDTGGTGFWHELYAVRGGFEAMYVDVQQPSGFLRFATSLPAKGDLFSARGQLRRGGVAETPAPYTEKEIS